MSSYRGKHVFVVDDTSFMRASLVNLLVEFGFSRDHIHEYENGRMALDALLAGGQVDVVFSDWNMPILSGLEFLKILRSQPTELSKTPVVMITTVSEKPKVIEALRYKLSGYLLKPVEKKKLFGVLQSVFEGVTEDDA